MKPRRILGLQLKRLGDIILTTPAMQMLCDTFPEASVDLMVDPKLAGFENYVSGCNVIPAPRGLGDYLNLSRAGYDVVLDFTGQDRCLIIAALTGAAHKLTFRKYHKKLGRSLCYKTAVKSSLRDNHITNHLADLSREVGTSGKAGRPTLRSTSQDWQSASSKLQAAGLPDAFASRYILLHPGTARPEKFWAAERWGKVIDFLTLQTGLPVVLSSSPDLQERAHLDAVVRTAAAPTIQMAGTLSLGEFLAVVAHATLLACVDSAPVHMADAFNTPVFALFGPTDPRIWGPRFAPHCWVRGNPDAQEAESMSTITLEMVLTQLGEFLESLPTVQSEC
jgi:ADP-heptose:LPS heptosyltransferase